MRRLQLSSSMTTGHDLCCFPQSSLLPFHQLMSRCVLACRHNRPVPVPLVPLCQAVCMLHDVRRGAHYHQENCHHLLQRLILVQDYLLALPLTELQGHSVLLAKLSVLVQDVYDVFNQFSDRLARAVVKTA